MPRFEVDVDFREVEPVSIQVVADTREQAETRAIELARPIAWEVHIVDVADLTEREGADHAGA